MTFIQKFCCVKKIVILFFLILSGCAYYNTLFNAERNYQEGIKALAKTQNKSALPSDAKKYFETTIEKCWKLIEIYSDKSKYADDALLYIAKSEYHLRKYSQARLHLEQFFKKYSKSNLIPEGYLWYGKVLFRLNDGEKATEYLLRAIHNARSNRIRAQANFELGQFEYNKKNYSQAIQYFEKALREKPDDEYRARLQYFLGQAYYIQQDYQAAIKQFERVRKYSPTLDIEYRSKYHLAKSYTALKKFEKANILLRKMLTAPRFQNYSAFIQTAIAEIYEKQEMYDDAVEMYRKALRKKKAGSGRAVAAFNLGRLFEKVYRNIDSAVVYYGKVRKLNPQFDSLEIAEKKKIHLGELKKMKDAIHRDTRLVYRLKNDKFFRDSLYQAQREDSLIQALRARGKLLDLDTLSSRTDSNLVSHKDSLKKAQEESLKTVKTKENPLKGFRETIKSTIGENLKAKTTAKKPSQQEKPRVVEKRKLHQIEEDLKNNRFHLAEYFLLQIADYDSAARQYWSFLEQYEDTVLIPKALYSLVFIYSQPGHEDSSIVKELSEKILREYPDSPFAREIKRQRGMLKAEPGQNPEETQAHKLFLTAESLYFAGKIDQALQFYQKIADMPSPSEWRSKARFAIAWIYEKDFQDTSKALQAYKRILEQEDQAGLYAEIARKKISPPLSKGLSPGNKKRTIPGKGKKEFVKDKPKSLQNKTGEKLSQAEMRKLQSKKLWRRRRNKATRIK